MKNTALKILMTACLGSLISLTSANASAFPAIPQPNTVDPYTGGLTELAYNCIPGGSHWGVAWKVPGQPKDMGVFANGGGATPPLPLPPPDFRFAGICGSGAAYFDKDYPCPSGYVTDTSTGQCIRTTAPAYICPTDSNATLASNECVCSDPAHPYQDAHGMKCLATPPSTKNAGMCKQGEKEGEGNPCNPATGIKTQFETVYRSSGEYPLTLELAYNSRLQNDPLAAITGPFGHGWIGTYQRKISVAANGSVGTLRPDGRIWSFNPPVTGYVYVADGDISDRLTRLVIGTTTTGWTLVSADGDRTEAYDAAGKLLSIADRSDLTQAMTYSDGSTPVTVAPAAGLLIKVTDNFGREIQFNYDTASRVTKLIDQAGQQILFAYDAANNLASVTHADNTVRTYHYNEPANTSGTNLPNHLTGITDENNVRFATYQYDAQGRAIVTEHAGGAQRYSFLYNTNGTTDVTDPFNTIRTYNFNTTLGVVRN